MGGLRAMWSKSAFPTTHVLGLFPKNLAPRRWPKSLDLRKFQLCRTHCLLSVCAPCTGKNHVAPLGPHHRAASRWAAVEGGLRSAPPGLRRARVEHICAGGAKPSRRNTCTTEAAARIGGAKPQGTMPAQARYGRKASAPAVKAGCAAANRKRARARRGRSQRMCAGACRGPHTLEWPN